MPQGHTETIIRRFLLVEAISFLVAASIHAGIVIGGYEHGGARIAESVIGAVLLAGLAVSWIRPAWTRGAGLVAQGFALLGACVGLLMVLIGVGPQSAPDRVYHVAILLVLVWGLVVAARARPSRVVG